MSEIEEYSKKIRSLENELRDVKRRRTATALDDIGRAFFQKWAENDIARQVRGELSRLVRIESIDPDLGWSNAFNSELQSGGSVRVVSVDLVSVASGRPVTFRYTLWLGRGTDSYISIEPKPTSDDGRKSDYKRRVSLVESKFKQGWLLRRNSQCSQGRPTSVAELLDEAVWPFSAELADAVRAAGRTGADQAMCALRVHVWSAMQVYDNVFDSYMFADDELYSMCRGVAVNLRTAWELFNARVLRGDVAEN